MAPSLCITPTHPLDRPVWSALTGPQAHLAVVRGGARRFDPAYNLFAATADDTPASVADLARLITDLGEVALAQPDPPPSVDGASVAHQAEIWQMWAPAGLADAPPAAPACDLGEPDAPQMFALARLTEPGPFFARTHQLGSFIGVNSGDRLAAMAGERMRAPGFTEVSAVCTHPDFRGRGYAAALTHAAAARIIARGERPFLHVYASNAAAIEVYRRLGFELRRTLVATFLIRA